MLRITAAILFALSAAAPLACDVAPDDEDGDTATEASTGEASTGEDDGENGEEAGGEAIDPTPVPAFQPPLKDCRTTSPARVRDCDP